MHAKQVGYMIIEELKEVDLVSMIRFAAVYHSFSDIHSFRSFIDDLVDDEVCEEKDD